MAKSLRCKDCGALLLSVAEAQNHGEITGHANFEETTEPVTLKKCTVCGKACRTQVEQSMHTKFTGHDQFQDADSAELNTEQQMKAAQAVLDGKDPEDMDTDTPAEDEEVNMVPAQVDENMLKELESMGFGTNRATRALHFCGTQNVEAAINWIVEHENDADIDEPLLVPEEKEKKPEKEKLTPEEARKKAEELVRRAKEKREREEREAEILREKERIRAGKEMQLAKRQEEELARKRIAEARRREKEEDAKYKEALRLKLEEDRKERRRKLGLPEELTEEEKEKERERLAKKAEDEKRKVFGHVKPISAIEKLRAHLVSVKKQHAGQEEAFKTCCITMGKYLTNIAKQPNEPKFRSIKLSNAAFQTRVAAINGSLEFLMQCGFEESDGVLHLAPEKTNADLLTGALNALNAAVTNPFFGAL